ncbi:MAG: hypothetical protein ABJE47_23370 [bacterium]
MTLLEVIVALTVAGAALAAGASTLGFLADQQARTGAQAVASAHAVRSTLRDWIAGAELSTQGDADFRGVASNEPGASNDEFTFVTSAPTDIAPSGTLVRLRIERSGADSLRGLVADLSPWRTGAAPTTVQLAPEATGLVVRYRASVFDEQHWAAQWAPSPVLPAAVKVRVLFDDAHTLDANDRAAHALLAIPMVITLGARR